ncbi:hypothetical protein QNI19_02480 [Cytophagaceae bacterium DM2B3-1]|uniref:Uncharacterized protein n=1 Tax=Xanthocytophaga flava TaxID=3048013 RepID=A0ABT7CFM0_9BACT|nr:hypothetical protein [Xanthocytophaga flavus]MDJ1471574.1 hypothetical protein [Xanthocytophaga flavus]MDJ1491780.1 hypothetical protein [Xanthocytophaga flavus]
MQRLIVFWGLWLWCISCIPCRDELPMLSEESVAEITVLTSYCQGDPSSSADLCSPLCVCTCCGISLISPLQVDFSMPTLIYQDSQSFKSWVAKPVYAYFSFWQPPKIG